MTRARRRLLVALGPAHAAAAALFPGASVKAVHDIDVAEVAATVAAYLEPFVADDALLAPPPAACAPLRLSVLLLHAVACEGVAARVADRLRSPYGLTVRTILNGNSVDAVDMAHSSDVRGAARLCIVACA